MEFDEMMNALTSISERYGTTMEILSDAIGYEYTESLLRPFFDYILPSRNEMVAESFLKVIDEVAAKLFFYKEGRTQDVYYSRIENFVRDYEIPQEKDDED